MKRERHRHPELDGRLPPPGQTAKRARHHGGVEKVPAEQRGDQVGEAEDVKPTRQHGARDAVEHAQVPRDLRPVDGEVRAYRSPQPLRSQDRAVHRHGFGCNRSGIRRERNISLGDLGVGAKRVGGKKGMDGCGICLPVLNPAVRCSEHGRGGVEFGSGHDDSATVAGNMGEGLFRRRRIVLVAIYSSSWRGG